MRSLRKADWLATCLTEYGLAVVVLLQDCFLNCAVGIDCPCKRFYRGRRYQQKAACESAWMWTKGRSMNSWAGAVMLG